MTITPEIVARVILGRPDHLDDQGNPDPIPGVAELLELHGDHVTRCVADWATTLTRPGDRPTSRRPPSDEEAGSTPHSDPTGNAATGFDELREIDRQWARALSTAHGWACQIATSKPQSTPTALREAARTIGTGTGVMQLTRLHSACVELERIIVMCRPDLTPPEEIAKAERECPACVSKHEERRVMCKPCDQLQRRHPEYDDEDFVVWVQRRIIEGTLSRPNSKLHRKEVA